MSQITRETIQTKEHNDVSSVKVSRTLYAEQIIYFALGALEVLLGFRFVLKMLGASQASGFVRFIYDLSRIFIMPFEGIFRRATTEGIETTAIVEPATLVALLVYAVLAWGMVSLIRMIFSEVQSE